MCFRAWLHDVKLELYNKQKETRIVEKHFIMWKKRIDLNSIATEIVRASFILLSRRFSQSLNLVHKSLKTEVFKLDIDILYLTRTSTLLAVR